MILLVEEVQDSQPSQLVIFALGRKNAKHDPNACAMTGSVQSTDDTMVTPCARSPIERPTQLVQSPELPHAIHEMRAVAGSIQQIVLRSHTHELVSEAKKHLALSATMTVGCVIFGLMSTSIISFPYMLAIGLLLASIFFGLRFNSSLQRCRAFLQAE